MLTYTTYASSTVGVLYTAGDLALQVAAGEGGRFPTNGDFWVRIGNAQGTIRKGTARVGDLLTLEAGAKDGTVDAGAAVGMSVDWVLSAEALNQLRADLVQTGTYAAKPAAAAVPAGTLYLPQDSVYNTLRSNGATWDHFKDGKLVVPPVLGDLTWNNQGGATVDASRGGLYMVTSASSDDLRSLIKAVTPPYSVEVGFLLNAFDGNYNGAGLHLRESSSDKMIELRIEGYGKTPANKWTNSTTFNSAYSSNNRRFYGVGPHYMRVVDDGANRISYVSVNGTFWHLLYTVARTDFCVCNQCGFGLFNNNGTVYPEAWLFHLKFT